MVRSRTDKSTAVPGPDVQWTPKGAQAASSRVAPSREGPADPLMATAESPTALEQAVRAALATVDDPEIHKPITDLGMVKGVEVSPDGHARIGVYLTVAG